MLWRRILGLGLSSILQGFTIYALGEEVRIFGAVAAKKTPSCADLQRIGFWVMLYRTGSLTACVELESPCHENPGGNQNGRRRLSVMWPHGALKHLLHEA